MESIDDEEIAALFTKVIVNYLVDKISMDVIIYKTQAGTYVKEFVHSDFGRTRPSVGTLLGFELTDGMSILELDVEDVDLEWPPAAAPGKKEEQENGI